MWTKMFRKDSSDYMHLPLIPEEPAASSLSAGISGLPTRSQHGQIEYLNGLRGLACLSVYIWHFSWPYQPGLFFAYGLDEQNTSFLQLPFVRLIYAGDAMVRVFFVLSGLVLSLGPLRAAYEGDIERVAKRVASLGIRRGFRLFIPPVVASICTLIASCLGWLDNLPPSTPAPTRAQQHARIPLRQPNVGLQILDWLHWVVQSLMNPWPSNTIPPASQYGSQFWTIPHEFRCSMAVFMLLVVLAPVHRRVRLFTTLGLSAYCMALRREQEELSLFLAGMGLAQMKTSREEGKPSKRNHWAKLEQVFAWFALVMGLYLLSWPPNKGYLSPPFRLLGTIDRQHNHWHNLGATMLLSAVLKIRLAQRFLSLRPILYLGKISYALYCVHYLIALAAGSRLLAFFWAWTGKEGWLQEQGGFLLAFGLTTCAVITASDVFHRTVDSAAISLARKVEDLATK
ncbi:acyltransferase [Colletotrichum musicola]|uniref:Acyltransferase n=1 Tax=Colletotrichum musicola TaxID=2175873 RepID=A0A8H6KF59_9PEZI|nr:acyltransferase [Colletotrichum musicola]